MISNWLVRVFLITYSEITAAVAAAVVADLHFDHFECWKSLPLLHLKRKQSSVDPATATTR